MILFDQIEREAAGLASDEPGTMSFYHLAKQEMFAVTHWAFVYFQFAIDVLIDQSEFKAAGFAVDKRGTLGVSHNAPFGSGDSFFSDSRTE
ncbi:MAG TPA: hypothetical protein VKR81_01930 [Candidatus Binatia bacterium]|nr:hypothetical protein [Candidatus Binatia bacterium]